MTTVGIVGGGQLARMLALAGLPLGIRCRVLEPAAECPAAAVAEWVRAELSDVAALRRLADGADVLTYEREHLPVPALREVTGSAPLRPSADGLWTLQHRARQRRWLAELGIAQPRFAPATDEASYGIALATVGLPAVVKSSVGGFDGRGQRVVRDQGAAAGAIADLRTADVVVEAFVPFDEEVALVAVRGIDGGFTAWPLVRTVQVDGALGFAAPHPEPSRWQPRAEAAARRIAEGLGHVGVLCVEFFVVGDELLVNEIAPRVHNSGHWTIEASECSQFENHLRAVLGWPLGSTRSRGAWAFVNVLGELPDRALALRVEGLHWHEYGKQPKPRRKIGHLTITAPSDAELQRRLTLLAESGLALPSMMTVPGGG